MPLAPSRDVFITCAVTGSGATQERTLEVVKQVEKHFMEDEKNNVQSLFTVAGFSFAGASEINANPRDDRDHPFGVWTLPPIRQSQGRGDQAGRVLTPEERAAFDAIGESDRMTLRLRKPE